MIGLFAVLSAVLLQQPIAQTATITGRLVDEATGRPIAGGLVVILDDRFSGVRRTTDADGRFSADGLAPGTYRVTATAGEFRATHASTSDRSGRLLEVSLAAGQTRDISIGLIRALAISGHVLDEAGRPLSRVGIRLRHLESGRNIHSQLSIGTDDRGAFRIFGLAPGRYLVCAEVHADPTFDARLPVAPERFVNTCYPSAPDETRARVVQLTSGDVEGLEIRLRRERTYSISGQVIDASGAAPSSFDLSLTRIEKRSASGSTRRIQSSTFTIRIVVPGRYAVGAASDAPSPTASPEQLGFTFIDVTADVENLVIAMRMPVTVRGSVIFEGGIPPGLDAEAIHVDPQAPDLGSPTGNTRNAAVGDDHTFTLPHLFGPQVLQIRGLPTGTAVRSMLYRGRDILDRATEFSGDPRDAVEIFVTTRVAEVTGRVVDDRGAPVRGARIYLFPADPARWVRASPRTASTSASGTYVIPDLAPGDYLAVAISAVDQREIQASDWSRPTPHERLSTLAEPLSLLDGDRRVLDLRLTPIPEEWKR